MAVVRGADSCGAALELPSSAPVGGLDTASKRLAGQ
jgi:hypothetical protein